MAQIKKTLSTPLYSVYINGGVLGTWDTPTRAVTACNKALKDSFNSEKSISMGNVSRKIGSGGDSQTYERQIPHATKSGITIYLNIIIHKITHVNN